MLRQSRKTLARLRTQTVGRCSGSSSNTSGQRILRRAKDLVLVSKSQQLDLAIQRYADLNDSLSQRAQTIDQEIALHSEVQDLKSRLERQIDELSEKERNLFEQQSKLAERETKLIEREKRVKEQEEVLAKKLKEIEQTKMEVDENVSPLYLTPETGRKASRCRPIMEEEEQVMPKAEVDNDESFNLDASKLSPTQCCNCNDDDDDLIPPQTPLRAYPRQSIGQWSVERSRNNMSVRSLVSSLEVKTGGGPTNGVVGGSARSRVRR